MAVFRVEKTDNYTVMSNYHLRDRSISLKAKGLLSQMLSLPPEWDYTLQGLAYINKEGINSVREGVKELEKAGYIKRRRVRGDKGLFAGNEYVIRELPESEKPSYENRTVLLMWICIGVPYGIRRMFLWLVPHKYDLAGTVGVVALDVVLGGIIGGFALIFQILGGVIETVKG